MSPNYSINELYKQEICSFNFLHVPISLYMIISTLFLAFSFSFSFSLVFKDSSHSCLFLFLVYKYIYSSCKVKSSLQIPINMHKYILTCTSTLHKLGFQHLGSAPWFEYNHTSIMGSNWKFFLYGFITLYTWDKIYWKFESQTGFIRRPSN